MADDQPQSIADRIASLKLNQVGRAPGQSTPAPSQDSNQVNGANGTAPAPPPPSGRPRHPPPPRPSVPARPNGANTRINSTNVPPTQDHPRASHHDIGNTPQATASNPAANGMDGISRPALPPRTSTQSSQRPSLPPRRPSDRPSPALPPRRPSEAPSTNGSRRPSAYTLNRKESNESVSSLATARSGVSGISNGTSVTSQSDRFSLKAPAYDPSSLPPLPANKSREEKEADYKKYNRPSKPGLRPQRSTPSFQPKQTGTTAPPPLPGRSNAVQEQRPPLPGRTSAIEAAPARNERPPVPGRTNTIEDQPARIEPPPRARAQAPPPPKRSALSMGFDNKAPPEPQPQPQTEQPPQPEYQQEAEPGAPPPIPKDSRPDLAALQASKPKPNGATAMPSTAPSSCLHCRDFSGPDTHAAQFPRETLPSHDLSYVAHQLTSPFPSPTDKARAIFTWLHHNIAYDTVAFFNNAVKPSTPTSTLSTGLAVCEGYAGLFAALAIKSGLEALVVSGHGKGYSHTPLAPTAPLPTFKAGHAWNAVKIDHGHWKLIDACWGAGTVSGPGNPYKPGFAPTRFTQTNESFGRDHFPGDSNHQLRADGTVMSWETYMRGDKKGCGARFFSGYVAEEGLDPGAFSPREPAVSVSACEARGEGRVRFSFQKVCPHWDPLRNGRGEYFLYVLSLPAWEGGRGNHVPFETDGGVWWVDVDLEALRGSVGGEAKVWTVRSFDGGEGRGVSSREYRERKGRVAMGFGGVVNWDVVASGVGSGLGRDSPLSEVLLGG